MRMRTAPIRGWTGMALTHRGQKIMELAHVREVGRNGRGLESLLEQVLSEPVEVDVFCFWFCFWWGVRHDKARHGVMTSPNSASAFSQASTSSSWLPTV